MGSSSYSLVAGTPSKKQLALTMSAELCKVCAKPEPCNNGCDTCKQLYNCVDMAKIQNADPLQGTKNQSRCTMCSRLFSAMTRAKTKFGDVDGWGELAQDQRTDFMKRSHGLLGADLKKSMTESVQESRMTRTTTTFAQSGKFIDIEGPDGAKEKYKGEPEKLANLLANSKEITCPIWGVQQIWIPEYFASKAVEDREEEIRKRSATADRQIKAVSGAAKKKPRKIATGAQGALPDGDMEVDQPKPIREAQLKRIEKCIPVLEDISLKFSQKLAEVEAPDNEGVIGVKVVEKAKELDASLAKVLTETSEAFAKKSAIDIKAIFEKVATTSAEAKKMTKKLTVLLEADEE